MNRDLKSRHGVEAVRTYLDGLDRNIEKGAGLWLMGNTGTGKTSLAMLLAKEALSRGKSVAVYFAPKLLTRIRMTYQAQTSEDSYDAFFRRLTSVDLLYVDDLGSERRTDWVVEQLYALVNERYENEKSIVITSNAKWDSNLVKSLEGGQKDLADQVGLRTVSRLSEICADPIPLFGADRRVDFALSAAP